LSSTGYVVVKYGRASDTVAGEPSFKKDFDRYQNELERFGKRPDLLVFDRQNYPLSYVDLSEMNDSEIVATVRKATAGIEVRSSNYLAQRYRPGRSSPFQELSFTIKVEDLHIVLRWIRSAGVPHIYVQATLDEVHALPFSRALRILSEPQNLNERYSVDEDPKNQFKTTLKIPFSQGIKIGDITEDPSIIARRRELPGGRLVFYVEFSGGNLTPIPSRWNEIISDAEHMKSNPADD